ncbi:hypothetical protein PS683_04056 [Pseudomonas fluorescens]|uniref:Type I restriction modification DNA specificity domain-containing protein n=1 Tax=Pseudomonas fluorescens TaxID=294 RepID=A0A5E6VD17_PSEFL|nr:hypothetical protein PS683_04056 [Pseudomonas fluorescens]VVN15051.1 hypothetical protein PS683_04056 [Pseudomonas fluorescens]
MKARSTLPAEFQRFPKCWEVLPFSSAIEDRTGGNPKVKKSEYEESGELAVVDQGQSAVAGYVNDFSLACKEELPCLLFGDHTRIFKYVDKPFVLGADGVKVLVPKDGFDKRFLFHYLKQVRLPENAGYSRHYKFLKETFIPKPPLEEQKRIAAILDKADAIRHKRQQANQLADQFLRSVFLDMFGEPVINPKDWDTKKLMDVGTLDRGKSRHRPRNDPALLGGAHPLVQTGDVAGSGGYIRNYKSTYSDLGLQQSRKWPKGTLCITIAANIAKTGILTFDACFPDSVVGFTANEHVTVEYIQHWLSFLQKNLEANAPESAQKNINLEILRDLDIPVPDIGLQKRFSEIVAKVVENSERALNFTINQDNLFSSLSQRAFANEL